MNPGKINYEAYTRRIGSTPLPFDELPTCVQEAFTEGALAVLRTTDKTEPELDAPPSSDSTEP